MHKILNNRESIPVIFVPQPVLPPSLTNHHYKELPAISTSNNQYFQQPPPIANAGHDQVVFSGSTVFLNGSKSGSPNGIILAYSWKQIPTGSIHLGGVNSPIWEFTAPKVTTNILLRFQLNVTDNWGQTSNAFVSVLDKPALIGIHASPSTQIHKAYN
jgi:K319-like protein